MNIWTCAFFLINTWMWVTFWSKGWANLIPHCPSTEYCNFLPFQRCNKQFLRNSWKWLRASTKNIYSQSPVRGVSTHDAGGACVSYMLWIWRRSYRDEVWSFGLGVCLFYDFKYHQHLSEIAYCTFNRAPKELPVCEIFAVIPISNEL